MAKNRKLGKTTAQRKAMLRTQVTDLLVNEKITTTLARAKETQAIANSLIALAIKEKDNFQMEDKKIVRAKRDTNGNKVTELVKSEAKRYGVRVIGSEVIGLCPMKALIDSAEYYLQIEDFDFEGQVLENYII